MAGVAFIGLGTNLPWRGASGPDLLRRALAVLEEEGLPVRKASSIWRSPPWPPGLDQPDYHNAVVEIDPGARDPEALFELLLRVERRFGRERRERWGPRTLDLDLLALGEVQGTFGGVTAPHPRLHERAFVLVPLAEIAPDWRHPGSGRSVAELLGDLTDASAVQLAGRFGDK